MTQSRTRLALAVAFWLLVAALSCVHGVSQEVLLTLDRATSVRNEVVNAVATVPGGQGGTVEFLDGDAALLTQPLSPRGIAVLRIASLARGVHRLSAIYRTPAGTTLRSDPVQVTILGRRTDVSARAPEPTTGNPFQLRLQGLPPSASGVVTVTEAGHLLGSLSLPPGPHDLPPQERITELADLTSGPTQDHAPVYVYEAQESREARLATLAWYALPQEYKQINPGSLTIPILTSGGPILLWARGAFRLEIDGVPTDPRLLLPVEAGLHTLVLSPISPDAAVLAVGTPPPPGEASVHPLVLALSSNPGSDLVEDVALLTTAGLDVRIASAAPREDPAIALQVPTLSLILPVGDHTLQIAYSGDDTYEPSSHALDLRVAPRAQSRVTFTTANTSYPANAALSLTASVAPASATGSVLFVEGGVALASASLLAGSASAAVSLAPGIHTLSASYSGDATNDPAASPSVQIQVVPGPTTLTLSPLPATIVTGTVTALTATVSPGSATGGVSFQDAFTPAGASAGQILLLGSASLANGHASVTPAALLPGTHVVSATYAGDDRNLAATTPPLTLVVEAIPTTTVLAPVNDAPYGAPTQLTAAIAPGGTGTVFFRDSVAGLLGQSAVAGTFASLSTSPLAPGTHTFTAAYSGDATHAGSTSAGVSATILPSVSITALTLSASVVDVGTTVVLNAVLTPATATGTVLFRDSQGSTLGQAPLAGGSASLALPGLGVGVYSISATYAGDAFLAPSASPSVPLQVNALTTTTTLLSPAPTGYGTALSLSAAIVPADATGTVSFTDSGQPLGSAPVLNGAASLPVGVLSVGSHALLAVYSGDARHTGSASGPATASVNPNSTTTTTSLAQTAVPSGIAVVINIRVTCGCAAIPAGIVSAGGASAPLANGSSGSAYATLSVPAAALGPFTLTATFAGTPEFLSSAAAPLSYSVVPTPTAGAFTLSSAQVAVGTQVTLTARLTSASTTPTGSITFRTGATVIATVALDPTGQASTTLTPGIGVYGLTADYTPTGLFAVTSLAGQTLTVTPPLTLALAPASVDLRAGGTASSTLLVTPLSGFRGSATAQCLSPVKYVTCTVDAPGTLWVPARLTVHLTAAASLTSTLLLRAALLLILPLALFRRRKALLPVLLIALSGCASGGDFQKLPTGPQILHLQVTAAGITAEIPLTVNVSD